MFPEYGFVDTLNEFSDVGHDSSIAKIFINPYAAVPSMHCAFAMMIGATGVMVCRHWWSKACWAFWPLLVAWVMIVTANHYWVDCRARLDGRAGRRADRQWQLARARPEAWACPAPRPAARRGPQEARGVTTSLTSDGILGARAPAARKAAPAPATGRSCAPTRATG